MKFSLSSVVFLLSSVLFSSLSAEITEALTPEQVAAKRRAGGEALTLAGAKKTSGEIQIEERKVSLLAESDYLIGYYGYTLVPKGAVFTSGKSVQLSANAPSKGKFLNWEDFYRKHRAGLRLLKISDAQWAGKASLEPVRLLLEDSNKSNQTVMTSLNGFPVSIKALSKNSITPKE